MGHFYPAINYYNDLVIVCAFANRIKFNLIQMIQIKNVNEYLNQFK